MESGRQDALRPGGDDASQAVERAQTVSVYRGDVARPRVGEMDPSTMRSLEGITLREKVENGIFSADSPDFDTTGDNKFDDTQALMAVDAARDNNVKLDLTGVVFYTDRKKEDFSKEAVAKIEEIVDKNRDDPAAITDNMNMMRKRAMQEMFGRVYPSDEQGGRAA